MKNFSSLLLFLILFQSCFSYKTVDFNSIPIEKGTYIKGTFVSKNEQILTLDNNGQLQKIPVSKINEVKVRKFSILKSSGFVVSSVILTAVFSAVFVAVLIAL
jgi:hypothetical protein